MKELSTHIHIHKNTQATKCAPAARERTTTGSTNAVQSSLSSNKARTKDTMAEPSRIRTSWSLNCSRTSSHSGVGGSSARAVLGQLSTVLLFLFCLYIIYIYILDCIVERLRTHHWDRISAWTGGAGPAIDRSSPRRQSA